MEIENIFSKVRFSDIYVKNILDLESLKGKDSEFFNSFFKTLSNNLISYAKQHGFCPDETFYFFTKKLIKDQKFFLLPEEISCELLYNAIYWAALQESKNKSRAKNGKMIIKSKEFNLFTKLEHDIITGLFSFYQDNEFMLEIELQKYLMFFYDLATVKRDRRKNNDI